MNDVEQRLALLEAGFAADLGNEQSPGAIRRSLLESHRRWERVEKVLWLGNGAGSLVTQIARLRTELRTIAVCLGVFMPVVFKLLDLWLAGK